MSEPIQTISQGNYILQAPPPSSTMSTTALEYDSSGFISGYAGSAFAGAVSANSPLSGDGTKANPLGVVASDVARMLGIDETVLWSGDIIPSGVNFTASESLKNFNKVQFWINEHADVKDVHIITHGANLPNASIERYDLMTNGNPLDNSATIRINYFQITGSNTTYKAQGGGQKSIEGLNITSAKPACHLLKIVGIGRKV